MMLSHRSNRIHVVPCALAVGLALWLNGPAGSVATAEPLQQPRNSSVDASRLNSNYWSFQPIQRAKLENLKSGATGSKIDAFVDTRLRAAGLAPSPPADRRTIIRRLFITLHGLPPTPKQFAQWIGDECADWYEKLVDELLASPRYGERWATHWLDVVRYADSTGFETNRPRPNAYHYRDYVVRALNDDKPYDRFVFEQLAGDVVGEETATGFLVAGPHDIVKGQNKELALMQRSDELADIVNATTTAFLGLTVACARCHDHKFDPISQQDYYATEAIFAGVKHAERPLDRQGYEQLSQELEQTQERITAIEKDLTAAQARGPGNRTDLAAFIAHDGMTLPIDDTGPWPDTAVHAGFSVLADDALSGKYPEGTGLGEQDDPGSELRTANISGGTYSYWWHVAGKDRDLCTWDSKRKGRYRIWLSWSAAPHHAHDTTYSLDVDGNLETTKDQLVIARIDQRQIASGSTNADGKLSVDEPLSSDASGGDPSPRWSGFYDAGTHALASTSRIVLSSGTKGAAATADLLILQEEQTESDNTLQPLLQPAIRPAVVATQNTERFPAVEVRFIRFEVLATNVGETGIDELEVYPVDSDLAATENVALVANGAKATASGVFKPAPYANRVELVNDGKTGWGSVWISDRIEGGWVQIELPGPTWIERVVWSRDANGNLTDRLATRYCIKVSLDGDTWQTVATSGNRWPHEKVEQGAIAYPWITWIPGSDDPRRQEQLVELFQLRRFRVEKTTVEKEWPRVYAGSFSQPGATHLLNRGDPMAPREVVAPGCLSVIGSVEMAVDEQEPRRRARLAEWICATESGAGALAARVMVNRIWQHHFGQGLVATSSDYGRNGIQPSHPLLLDYLASELIDSGWSIKHVQRLIVHCKTFRQSNAPDEQALAKDAGNVLLWRFAPRRLEAEAIRDTVLLISGKLDFTMGGPGFAMVESQGGNVYNYTPKTTFSLTDWRRMIYAHRTRGEQDVTFGAFDCPDGGQVAPRRPRSTTALQALNLLNSPFILQQAKFLAERVKSEVGDEPVSQVNRLFELVFGREPSEQEREDAAELVRTHSLSVLCRAFFNANELLFVT
jgi:hypothetical protein